MKDEDISIHAPSRERPAIAGNSFQRLVISIHAPSRERLDSGYLVPIFVDISIHAPSRERQLLLFLLIIISVFQSTLPRGSDDCKRLEAKEKIIFQSTLPRGSDFIVFMTARAS